MFLEQIMKKPAGLGPRGSALHRAITSAWDIPPDLQPVLEHAARTLDDLDALQRALGDAELVVVGSTGQPVVNPLVASIAKHRDLLARLLRQLDLPELPDEHGQAEMSARSERAKKAADMRWANVRAIREGVG
jgi:hypothetical protein